MTQTYKKNSFGVVILFEFKKLLSEVYMKQSDKVRKEITKIELNCNQLLSIGSKMMNTKCKSVYNMDFIIMAIVKRSISISSAIKILVDNFNMTCARALVRMQLDTVLRLSAFWLSKDRNQMAKDVFDGMQINKMKDVDGNKMTDSYLVKKLGEFFTWIPIVYKFTSGYIHFSERHIFDPIINMNEEDKTISLKIDEFDTKFQESSWLEITKCANDCLSIIKYWLNDYAKERNSITNIKSNN